MALQQEKIKLVLLKCQAILTDLLKDDDNKFCVDCDAKSPRWASWNLGIFLCIRCAGIHRNLGVHISKVKSVNLDTWTPQQVACIQQMGNSRARAVYEANLHDNFRRPQTDSSLEQFIRAKYEAKKYIAKEWVQPALPIPTWDLEIEKQLKKRKEKKAAVANVEFPAYIRNTTSKSSGVSPKPLPKAPGGRNSSSPNTASRRSSTGPALVKESNVTKDNSATMDLIGLDMPSTENGKLDSSESGDIFGDFLAAPPPVLETSPNDVANEVPPTQSNNKNTEEESFFNQKTPGDSITNEKMSKDSILALFKQMPTSQMQGMNQMPQGINTLQQQGINALQHTQGINTLQQPQGINALQQQGINTLQHTQGINTLQHTQGINTLQSLAINASQQQGINVLQSQGINALQQPHLVNQMNQLNQTPLVKQQPQFINQLQQAPPVYGASFINAGQTAMPAQQMYYNQQLSPASGVMVGGVAPAPNLLQSGQGSTIPLQGGFGGVNPPKMQLSAANPFAQMQTHMASMSLGGVMSAPHPSPAVAGAILKGSETSPQSHHPSFSTNLWK